MKHILMILGLIGAAQVVSAFPCTKTYTAALSSVSNYNRIILANTGSSQPVRICSIDISWATASVVNFKIGYGTGTNCGTGTVDVSTLNQLTAWSKFWGDSPIIIPTGVDVCLYFSGSVSPGVTIQYENQ